MKYVIIAYANEEKGVVPVSKILFDTEEDLNDILSIFKNFACLWNLFKVDILYKVVIDND